MRIVARTQQDGGSLNIRVSEEILLGQEQMFFAPDANLPGILCFLGGEDNEADGVALGGNQID